MKLNDILKIQPSRGYLWDVSIIRHPTDIFKNLVNTHCKTTDIPKYAFSKQDIKIRRFYVGNVYRDRPQSISMSFIEDDNYRISNFFEEWAEDISTTYTGKGFFNNSNSKLGSIKETLTALATETYTKAIMIMSLKNVERAPLKNYVLFGVLLEDFAISGAGDSGEPMEVTATLSWDFYKRININTSSVYDIFKEL